MIDPRGIQEFKINNYCNYLMTTNNMNTVGFKDKKQKIVVY